jgi:hypothetical protein
MFGYYGKYLFHHLCSRRLWLQLDSSVGIKHHRRN